MFVFEDAAAAREALEVHRTVVAPAVLQGFEEISPDGLGEDAFGFAFTSGPAGGPGAIYTYRIGNAVFLVPGSGDDLDRDSLLMLARTVAGRAAPPVDDGYRP